MLFGSTSLLVADHAGSGKTLAYLAPLIQVTSLLPQGWR